MDDLDRQMIALLSANARLPISSLAATLGIARTTAQARLDSLERRGIIAGYTIRKGSDFAENEIYATVLLQLEPAKQAAVVSRLSSFAEVEAAFTASGRFDMILRVKAENTTHLDGVLDRISDLAGVKSTESLIRLSSKFDRAAK
ncbi:MAG: Lrp/AsnC family transcriptional regulator [Pseudomonadota bacterium]